MTRPEPMPQSDAAQRLPDPTAAAARRHPRSALPRWPALLATTALCALVTACGGGGGDDSAASSAGTDDSGQVLAESADSTVAATDATSSLSSALDTSVAVLATDPSASAAAAEGAPPVSALAASGDASYSTTLACAGGGSLTVNLSGPSHALLVNGTLDAGEEYSLTASACKAAAAAVQLDGRYSLSVTQSGNGTLGLTLASPSANPLTLGLPQGQARLTGSASLSRATTSQSTGGQTHSDQWTASAITLTTARQARAVTSTLSDLDLRRTLSTDASGAFQSATLAGQMTLSASGAARAFSAQLQIQRSLVQDASGDPLSGTWQLSSAARRWTVDLADGVVTLQIDDGNNGSIDRSKTWTRQQFLDAAGT